MLKKKYINMRTIHYGRQYIDKADLNQVVKVLKSDWITQGPKVKEFEKALARYCGVKYAVCVSSATAGLHLACLAAGLKKGDEAITTPITFLATSNAVLYTGARPVFSDIEYNDINIDPEQIQKNITRKTRAILPVHFGGLPCEMERIARIARKNRLWVIEDASHALGAEYKSNRKWFRIGSCRHSDMAVFSFHPVKPITTGEGGAITTNNKTLYKRLLAMRSHSVYRDRETRVKGPWYYEMRELGLNYRLTDFQCVLGISQLAKLNRFLKKRRQIAERYDQAFRELGDSVRLPSVSYPDRKSAWHLYVLRLNTPTLIKKRRAVFEDFASSKIRLQVHYIPIYKQPYYKRIGYTSTSCPNAESYYKECLSLPIYVSLKTEEQDYVFETTRRIILEKRR